ncbi:MAG: hypothetical protein KDA51_18135, partial [Planctomycetales bacterium]|nr:hypothetical protein [Planctomycetales bacterium]
VVIAAICCPFASANPGEVIIRCPEKIESFQSAVGNIPGWESWEHTWPSSETVGGRVRHSHQYTGMSFYGAHPSRHYLLAPDGDQALPTWSFGDSSGAWLVCVYRGTEITVTRALPPGLDYCQLVTEPFRHYQRTIAVCQPKAQPTGEVGPSGRSSQ